jgi:hypothetical protein
VNFNFQQFYFSVQGRVNRKQWWLRLILPILVITLVLSFVDRVIGIYDPNTGVGILSGLFALAFLIPAILVDIKRWHDQDKSGVVDADRLDTDHRLGLVPDRARLLGRHAWTESVRPAADGRVISIGELVSSSAGFNRRLRRGETV